MGKSDIWLKAKKSLTNKLQVIFGQRFLTLTEYEAISELILTLSEDEWMVSVIGQDIDLPKNYSIIKKPIKRKLIKKRKISKRKSK